MEAIGATAVRFGAVVARELVDARTEVREWAEELYLDQLATWETRRRRRRLCKPRPPTREECFEKSRQIRLRRERDHTYWNELTSSHPQH